MARSQAPSRCLAVEFVDGDGVDGGVQDLPAAAVRQRRSFG